MEIEENGSLPLIIQTEKGNPIYNISHYKEIFEEFSDLFGIDFLAKISRTENWPDRYHTSPAELGMQLTRDDTNQYTEEYPNLTNATITIPATLIHPLTINLPEELVY